MKGKHIIIAALISAVPTFLELWLGNMWPIGSLKWGALTFGCLLLILVAMNWDEFVERNNGELVIKTEKIQNTLAWFLGFSLIIVTVWISQKDWDLDWPEPTIYVEVWVHPSRSEKRAVRDENKCKQDAYDALGAGPNIYTRFDRQRKEYVKSCMIGKGYVLERVDRGAES